MAHKRSTFEKFKQTGLEDTVVKDGHDVLSTSFYMKRQMIALRKRSGVTQEQMADLLGTKKSNISRLESLNSSISPRLATVEDYARVLGYSVRIKFEPQ
ncbi:helix-turn-helix domain-containing protein [Nitrosomonas marina]|uniref:DNA-binding transcriptional regulator, XRE-family HTH domain n=1 Tax=Nitrosomonas marina TaxID=917 RepID=A0A1H8G5F9_9PROT|nr:helix-turn-helix transcriptional regulator [Nitrosomonas marina]SEN38994.1 DNA-binding transcriptional regulator, XRE-family HTH domain [Nitrosomonas marina]